MVLTGSQDRAKERKKKEIGRPAEQTGGVSFGEHSRDVDDGRNPDALIRGRQIRSGDMAPTTLY